jgi:aryl-alcohol dehydrogenase-like predicted oxidoreductase
MQYNDGRDTSGARLTLFDGYMARYNSSMVKDATVEYAGVAKKHGLTPTELALAFCKSRWFVASTIFGATTMEQLRHNITAFEKDLPEEALIDIQAIFTRFKDPTIMG